MVPSAATPATAEPEISAKNIDAPITTIDRPPRTKPRIADANAISRREIEDAFMIAPAKMNSGIAISGKTGGAVEHLQRQVRQHLRALQDEDGGDGYQAERDRDRH